MFDELIHVQGNTNSCYVEIGLVQSLGIAVFRLEQKGALADRLTTAKKRDIFEKPLRDIKEQLTLEDCYPDIEKEEALYRDWTTNGNKGTIKALQALNTVVREVPEVFTGRSDQVRSLAGELQKMINQRDRYNESNALRALAGIYLLPVVQSIDEDLFGERVYSSNAIEGNTLDLRETVMILKQGILGGGRRREALEARNLGEAIRRVTEWLGAKRSCHRQTIVSSR